MKTKVILTTVVLGLALDTPSTLGQSASPYTSFTAFGDSLSDSGQFPDTGAPLIGGAPLHGTRFTNRTGPNYAHDNTELTGSVSSQLLANKLGVGPLLPSTAIFGEQVTGIPDGSNYAVGGYVTAQILASIVAPDGSKTTASETLSRTRNGYLVDFPAADPTGIYYILGGGNDLAGGIISSPETAAASAKNLADGAAALAAAGANYIVVPNLPNVGLSPMLNKHQTILANMRAVGAPAETLAEVAAGAKIEAQTKMGAEIGTGWFNTALDTQLNATGANVVRFDMFSLFGEVLADPESFGFDASMNLTAYTFDGGDGTLEHPVHGLNSDTPNPDALIFNDRLHPTTAGQHLLSEYAHSILAAPFEIGLLPEQALGAARAHTDSVHREVSGNRDGWRSFVSLGGDWSELGQASASVTGDADEISGLVGFTKDFGDPISIGLAYGRNLSDLELDSGSEHSLSADLITPLVTLRSGNFAASGTVGYGYLDFYQLDRAVNLGQASRTHSGETEGELFGASLRASYAIDGLIDGLTLGPVAGLDYYNIDVDGYSETGRSSTSLHFDDQNRESLQWQAGAFADYAVNEKWTLNAEVLYRAETEDETRSLDLGLNSMSAANDFSLIAFTPEDDAISTNVGVTVRLAENVQLGVGYRHIGSEDFDNRHSANLSLGIQF